MFLLELGTQKQKKLKKKKPEKQRQRWSKEEEEELNTLFSKNFKDNYCPGQQEIGKAVKISRSKGGLVHNRPMDNIKKKISNLLIKLNGRKKNKSY